MFGVVVSLCEGLGFVFPAHITTLRNPGTTTLFGTLLVLPKRPAALTSALLSSDLEHGTLRVLTIDVS